VVDGDGELTDFLRLPHIMKRRNGWNRDEAELKVQKQTNIQANISWCHLMLTVCVCYLTVSHKQAILRADCMNANQQLSLLISLI